MPTVMVLIDVLSYADRFQLHREAGEIVFNNDNRPLAFILEFSQPGESPEIDFLPMSPCDEYKKLVKEWQAARSSEKYAQAQERVEAFRKLAESLKSAMEEHVKVCDACKNS